MEEIFKTIQKYPNYEISNLGRVITKERKIRYTHAVTKKEHYRISERRFLKVYYNNRTGYKFVQLYDSNKSKNITIHRLVAETFLNNSQKLECVNHIDGNKHNNSINNLEWCSNSYNHKHATMTGLKAKGDDVYSSKLNDNSVHAIMYFLKKGLSHSEISKAFNVSRPTISLISKGKTWKHITLTGEELKEV